MLAQNNHDVPTDRDANEQVQEQNQETSLFLCQNQTAMKVVFHFVPGLGFLVSIFIDAILDLEYLFRS